MQKHLIACATLFALSLPSFAQSSDIGSVGKYEINIFGGGSFFGKKDKDPQLKLEDGGTLGARVTQNYWNYVSIEEEFRIHGVNNIRINNRGNVPGFGNRVRGFNLGPVFHFTPRESRFRPFLKLGVGFNWFGPTDDAVRQATGPAGGGFGVPVALQSEIKPIFSYGGGIKYKLHRRVGLRFDAEGFVSPVPQFGIPATPPAPGIGFANAQGSLNGLQVTGGLTFYMGDLNVAPPGAFTVGSLEASSTSAYEGDPLSFKLPVTNTLTGVTPKWTWFVNNQPVSGANTDAMAMKAGKPGTYEIKAIADADTSAAKGRVKGWLKKNPIAATARTATVTVKDWPTPRLANTGANPPSLTAATPAAGTSPGAPISVANAGTSTVNGRLGGFERPREIVYTFTTPEGRLAPGQTAGGLASQPNNRTVGVTLKDVAANAEPNVTVIFTPEGITVPAGSSRTIPISINVKDSHGPETNATVPVTLAVPAPPPPPPPPPSLEPIQLDDIIFSSGRSRVNNCGKRVLDQAYERAMANGDYDVVLIGHIDERESRLRLPRSAKPIDQQRVLNAASVLTAGEQPCKNLEPSRIKIVYAGTAQNSEFKSLLCQTSTNERATDRIRQNDANAKNRRVEVWLVPRPGKGRQPAGLQTQDLPTADLPKGCPR